MLIVSRFMHRVRILTGTFLAVSILATIAIYWSHYTYQRNTAIKSDLANAEAAVIDQYSSGDLVAFRTTLDNIGRVSEWVDAQYRNRDGEVIWKWHRPAKDGKLTAVSAQKPVLFENDEVAGNLSVTKNIYDSWVGFLSRVAGIFLGATSLWAVFVYATLFMAKSTLKPLLSLMDDLRLSASSHALSLASASNEDELSTIRRWFGDLTQAWLLERERAISNGRFAAIAATTQMVAHDVRKPFSSTMGLLKILQTCSTKAEMLSFMREFVPQIERSIASVNGMLADIMDVGSEGTLTCEVIPAAALVDDVLQELFSGNPDVDISLTYAFSHRCKPNIDSRRCQRVFANIIHNAAQAMGSRGQIWIKTRDVLVGERPMTEWTLGNSGSFIPADDLEHLFDAFFTKNKKGGTGLGLAIAKKVVTSHGGTIACRSQEGVGVEFIFTLPTSEVVDDSTPDTLSRSTKEIGILALQAVENDATDDHDPDPIIAGLLPKLKTKKPVAFLIVDDESIYQRSLTQQIQRIPQLAEYFSVQVAARGEDGVECALKAPFQIAIVDLDLGDGIDGYETARRLRAIAADSIICVHSNRSAADFGKKAFEAGANFFLPKTLGTRQILALVEAWVNSIARSADRVPGIVAVVDDSQLVLLMWKKTDLGHGVSLKTYSRPEDFLQELTSIKGQLAGIVTDQHFDNSLVYNGLTFAEGLRDKGVTCPVYLASNQNFQPDELVAVGLTRQVPKLPDASWPLIRADVCGSSS